MPRPKRGPRFGHSGAHEKAILANLASSLFWEGKVVTTTAKAKAVRPLAEKLITRARRNDLHSRRMVLRTITDIEVVTKLFDEVAPRYTLRNGGYTRIVKIGPRRGDGAEQALIELV
jgi:large subunit ribosomal protein L17